MLYLVATPIGNLGDFSPRAREVLEKVDVVACEDTRTSGQLFSLLGVHVKKTIAYHDFNEEKVVPHLIEKLQSGVDIALVSDAGMPARRRISDRLSYHGAQPSVFPAEADG